MISTNNLGSYAVAIAHENTSIRTDGKLTLGFDHVENRLRFFTRHPAIDV